MQPSVLLKTTVLRNIVQETSKIAVRSLSVSNVKRSSFKVQDQKDFQERVVNSKVPVIVDFFATWCGPCKMLTPRLESVVAEKKGEVLLAKVDIDENTDLALDYKVSAVPVIVAFKDGKAQESLVGLQDVDKLRTFVNKVVDEK